MKGDFPVKKHISLLLVLSFLLCMCGCVGEKNNNDVTGNVSSAPDTFSVGYAQADISPTGSVPLAGAGRYDERLSNQLLDPLYATCVAFSDGDGNQILLFCLDLLNSFENVIYPLRERIAEETGLPQSHVLFTASHTHSATAQDLDGVGTVAVSNTDFADKCAKIAKDALADLKPAQMYGAFTRPDGLNFVRHYVLADGTYQGKGVGSVPTSEITGHMRKADNLLQLVKFVREGGKDVLLINWQAHYWGATKMNDCGVSADYPGILRSELESRLDCHAAFVLGGSGNLASTSYIPDYTLAENYAEHGRLLADAAEKAVDSFQPLETGTIFLQENLYVVEGTIQKNPLYAFGFGDFGMVTVPFEIFDNNARAVREASNYPYTFYATCANDRSGYLPDDASFDYFNYEVGVTEYPRGTAEKIQQTLTEMINGCFAQSGQSVKERVEGYEETPFEPYTDDVLYVNPSVGDTSVLVQGVNNHYVIKLLSSKTGYNKRLLIENKELAEQIVAKQNVKLLFDDRNIVVGIAE